MTPPKRLFHISSMTTVMYEGEDYACISHVWGKQRMHHAKDLGIRGGVNWKVPLSHSHKISTLVNVMKHLEMTYCWMDVLCMPQDRQDEIDKEIPYMGDYYSNAKVTIILSTEEYSVSDDFVKWCAMMANVVKSWRDFTHDEQMWLRSLHGGNLLDVSKDPWYERVWILQETVLSRRLILVSGRNILNMSLLVIGLMHMVSKDVLHSTVFSGSEVLLEPELHMSRQLGEIRPKLVDLMNASVRRKCCRQQDRFYGILGALGYRDFVVDYDMDMMSINKKMVQYAYFRGDISWLSVGGDAGNGFVQPMYREFNQVGVLWKEDKPGSCDIKFEDDTMWINLQPFATITDVERPFRPIRKDHPQKYASLKLERRIISAFESLGFCGDIVSELVSFSGPYQVVTTYLSNLTKDTLSPSDLDKLREHPIVRSALSEMCQRYNEMIIVKATFNDTHIPLIVYGNADIGDRIMSMSLHNQEDKTLGIVYDGIRRKGLCIYKKAYTPNHDYVLHKFAL